MLFGWSDILVLFAFMIGMVDVGLYQVRKIKGTGDFLAGKRGFTGYSLQYIFRLMRSA